MRLLLRVYELLSRLKELRRTGWVERGVKEAESVASHSYSVVFLTVLLADLRGIDVGEAARMALLHDLPEAVLGDLTPRMKKSMPSLEEREREVVESLAKNLPPRVAELWLRAWSRYQRGEGKAAKLVREVDKLEMGLQAACYAERYGAERLQDIYQTAWKMVRDPELRRVLEEAWSRRRPLL